MVADSWKQYYLLFDLFCGLLFSVTCYIYMPLIYSLIEWIHDDQLNHLSTSRLISFNNPNLDCI